MSLSSHIKEEYIIRRINDWFIVYGTNKIYGQMQPYNLNYYMGVSGYILAFIDNYVLIRVNGLMYALVLGNVEASRFPQKFNYIKYLNNIVPAVSLVI